MRKWMIDSVPAGSAASQDVFLGLTWIVDFRRVEGVDELFLGFVMDPMSGLDLVRVLLGPFAHFQAAEETVELVQRKRCGRARPVFPEWSIDDAARPIIAAHCDADVLRLGHVVEPGFGAHVLVAVIAAADTGRSLEGAVGLAIKSFTGEKVDRRPLAGFQGLALIPAQQGVVENADSASRAVSDLAREVDGPRRKEIVDREIRATLGEMPLRISPRFIAPAQGMFGAVFSLEVKKSEAGFAPGLREYRNEMVKAMKVAR
jgi:hypothetical protein